MMTLSFVSVIGSEAETTETKDSPLYRIRTEKAIGEKVSSLVENLKTKFLGERVFWVPLIQKFPAGTVREIQSIGSEGGKGCMTCWATCQIEISQCLIRTCTPLCVVTIRPNCP